MLILGIETSCDETAIAILEKNKQGISVRSNIVSSQIALHAAWGGVVPNLAAREHLKNIIPVLNSALEEAKIKPSAIDLIAVTQGPGLIPALLIGTNFAKTLSYLWKKPLLAINHIEGHIYANFIASINKSKDKSQTKTNPSIAGTKINFPILTLVVSGGHTQIVLMEKHLKYKIVGETQDDAVGEAFDKVARILGLGYPGGPIISAQADNFKSQISNLKSNPDNLNHDDKKLTKKNTKKPLFPRPMLHSSDFNFSFSGLKTSVLYYVKKYRETNNLTESEKLPLKFIREIAYEFEEAATDVLVIKTIKAALRYNPKTIFLAGGVSANSNLREKLKKSIEKNIPQVKYILQSITYSTDNASMIAAAAIFRWDKMTDQQKKEALTTWKTLQANAQLRI